MAQYRLKGSVDGWEQSLQIDNGCTARQAGAARGPVDGAIAGHASEWDPFTLARRATAVFDAYEIGRARAPAAIVRATGLDDLPRLAEGLVSGLLQMAAAVAATTALGTAAGAALGALFGGVGAVPGAAAGGEIGFDVGMALLTWLGLGAMAVEIARGLGEVTALARRAVVTAWDAEDKPSRQAEIDAAGQCFADAIGKLMLLILIAVVARLTASQAVSSTKAAAGAAGDFVATLRRSRLGAEFAAWVEANAERLMRNPRLRGHSEVQGSSGSGPGATTPSRLKNQERSSGESKPTEPEPAATRPAKFSRPSVPSDSYPADMSAWKDANGRWKYPPDDGFLGASEKRPLNVGDKFDRFGETRGKFASPLGTDYQARALPPTSAAQKYYVYEVVKPIEVESGTIAPWFEQPGLGVQYRFEKPLQWYLDNGYIKQIGGPL